MPSRSLASNVANLVFAPPIGAYGLIILGAEWAGVALYAIALAFAFRLRFLDRFAEWPMLSQVTVFAGALLVAAGSCFRAYGILAYWLLLPSGAYFLLTVVAGLLLRRLG